MTRYSPKCLADIYKDREAFSDVHVHDRVSRNLRSSDVLNITRLHLDAVKNLEVAVEPKDEDGWTEEDDAEIADIIKEIDELESSEESTDYFNKIDSS